ncbi:hypothetical protein PPTG_04771 [Plasmopara halstedii]|uniref:Transcription intermediary factor 1-alpha n=1 Tax=Plasmopara halstedii TaxID=4781 RepID=A0A0P1A7L9_PLAHL|nr:hypothetical protein PPTG_04771 [Plasmopara halstedii]CEG36629.1 hypothetical protein PPTG_04771 [Plasmopara halstedii]|eukprot:XP_024572998.1 hypothetical protein PPTG_04771 [Plasmopara halstedii]
MYHGGARDCGDKKRQRLTPPPNEAWMKAIMNNGKKIDSCHPASTVTSRGVFSSSTVAWRGRAPSDYSRPSINPGPLQCHHYTAASRLQGKIAERPFPNQARPTESSVGTQGRRGIQEKLTDVAQGFPIRSPDIMSGYQAMSVADPGIYQERTTKGSVSHQNRTLDGVYQRRMIEAPIDYQNETANEAAAYPKRLIYGTVPPEEQIVVNHTETQPFQSRITEASTLDTMAKEYKKDKKLPLRVEEMLREQVNLDESDLQDAFSVAMEDLIPEKEANFVAKGLCHLCGISEYHFVPVVNFCPHADEHHSLCREHLRGVYRVRMEALFVGRNGSAPNHRLLRCLMCTRGCPCSKCIAEREQDIRKYKRYLVDTLHRSGQGSVVALKDHAATKENSRPRAAVPDIESQGRLTYRGHPNMSPSDDYQYAQYTPSTESDLRPSSQRKEVSNVQSESLYDAHTHVHTQDTEYEKSTPMEQNYHEEVASDMQAEPKSPHPPVPKRAAKDTSMSLRNVMADSAQASYARLSGRVTAPLVHQGSVESPSAATVLNCAESEKSLVQLLNSLNQGGNTAISTEMDASSQSSMYNVHRQSELRSAANETQATNEKSGNAQNSGDKESEMFPRAYPSRVRRREARPYQEQSSTSSDESDGISRPNFTSAEAQFVDEVSAQKPTTSDNVASNSMTSRCSASLDDDVVERDAETYSSDEKRTKPGLKLSVKVPSHEKSSLHVGAKKDTRLVSTPTSSTRGPGRPRKPLASGGLTPPVKKVAPQVALPAKKRRGRPPGRTKQGKKADQKTEDEVYDADHDEKREENDSESDSELDANLDFCEVCQGAGDLVCCDKCPRSYHLKCLHVTENDLPEGNWQCDECKKPSRFDAYSTAVASEKTLLDKCLKIVACLKSHPFSKPFLTPVENVPMYTRVVKQPMDLSKIENKLKKGAYVVDSFTVTSGVKEVNCTQFADDIRLMWSNCKLFNDDGSGITRAADILSAVPTILNSKAQMMELALDEEGAQVTAVTSYDPAYPPINILDGELSSKWVTTGSFPQEIVIQLATTALVARAKVWTRNVKEVLVESCSSLAPTKWDKLFDFKLNKTEGEMQIVSENINPTDASFIKLKFLSGWNDFAVVHRVSVEGSASRR